MQLTRRAWWRAVWGGLLAAGAARRVFAQAPARRAWREVSGIYPHLAFFNDTGATQDNECGIGAVVSWAGRLWAITYPPHRRTGSIDRLYEIDEALDVVVRPESVGGTHAARLVHRESEQLLIGPYAIDTQRRVRALTFGDGFAARITAYARHLTRPADAVYVVDMEGPIWELDVHTLALRRLFVKPVPGWHAKGAATAHGRLVVANNGELRSRDLDGLTWEMPEATWSRGEEDAGVLAEWDGRAWTIVSRRPHTEVIGPAGLAGAQGPDAPLWSLGWDRRSVLLHVRTADGWARYRVPKGSYTYDPTHGWFTEWPRIREIGDGPLLMNMHGTFFALPRDFGGPHASGVAPISTHLHYTTDYCAWNGRVVLAGDDTSILQNPLAAKPQSNLRFVSRDDLSTRFGPREGWGGVWVRDDVSAGAASDPLLVGGYARVYLHLAHESPEARAFTVESSSDARGPWRTLQRLDVPAARAGGVPVQVPSGDAWLRVVSHDAASKASAYTHLRGQPGEGTVWSGMSDTPTPGYPRPHQRFAALAPYSRGGGPSSWVSALLRPCAHSRDLAVLSQVHHAGGGSQPPRYSEVDASLAFRRPDAPERAAELAEVARIAPDHVDDHWSVLLVDADGQRWRLPTRWALPPTQARGLREVISERYLANYAGTFYEIPRLNTQHAPDFRRMKPVASHDCRITDFATWRGLLVLAGVRGDAPADEHCWRSDDGEVALWFGAIDDLWSLGRPSAVGGPWYFRRVRAGEVSDPYLIAGFEFDTVAVRHDQPNGVRVRIEVDALADGTWWTLDEIEVPPGLSSYQHRLPSGFAAHWIRFVALRDCIISAQVR